MAVITVLDAHLCVVAITDPVTPRSYLPMITGKVADAAKLSDVLPWIMPEVFLNQYGMSSGEIGVMLFFLISGFLILGSAEAAGPVPFLIRRVFRIYPLAAVIICGMASLGALYSAAYKVDGPFNLANTLLSATLLSGWAGTFYTLPQMWSLIAEVCFYIVIAAACGVWGRLGCSHLLALGSVCLLVIYVAATPPFVLRDLTYQLHFAAYNAMWIIYMLIGSAVSRIHAQPARWKIGVVTIAALAVMYIGGRAVVATAVPGIGRANASSVLALATMATGLLTERFVPPLRILGFLADISYPLYLLHIPLGWAIIWEATRAGMPVWVAISGAAAITTLLAWLLHIAVEQPSHRLGLHLTRRTGRLGPHEAARTSFEPEQPT